MKFLRILLKTLVVFLAIPLIPLLVWWGYNRFDEVPTDSARHWFAPIEQQLADSDNAWLYLLGLGAAQNDDPIALGRRRLDAYETRIAQPGMLPPSAAELALKNDPQPFRESVDVSGKIDYRCDLAKNDCFAWATKNAVQLDALAQANVLRRQRFQNVLRMPRLQELSTQSADDPVPEFGADSSLDRALMLRNLADQQRRGAGLEQLKLRTAFWQRVNEQSQSLFMKQAAGRASENSLRILDALVDRIDAQTLTGLDDAASVVLREPIAAQRNWEPALHRHVLGFGRIIDGVSTNPITVARYCRVNCWQDWLIAQFVAKQATLNLSARFEDALLEFHSADAPDFVVAQKRMADLWEANIPMGPSARETLHRMAYNFGGKTLAMIAQPAFPEAFLQHDREAFRRMIVLKIAALKQGIAPEKMKEFLAAQPKSLRNPFTLEPFTWDAATGEIRYAPKWKEWKLATVVYKPALGTVAPNDAWGRALNQGR